MWDRSGEADPEGNVWNRRWAGLVLVLAESRRRDSLTLWHLLARTTDLDRGRVYERLATLVDVPPGVTREEVVAGDKPTLQVWWGELGLEEGGWWR